MRAFDFSSLARLFARSRTQRTFVVFVFIATVMFIRFVVAVAAGAETKQNHLQDKEQAHFE